MLSLFIYATVVNCHSVIFCPARRGHEFSSDFFFFCAGNFRFVLVLFTFKDSISTTVIVYDDYFDKEFQTILFDLSNTLTFLMYANNRLPRQGKTASTFTHPNLVVFLVYSSESSFPWFWYNFSMCM